MKKDGRRKVSPKTVERMMRLRKQGLSYAKIADRLGLSMLTVYNYLKKENIEPGKKEKPAAPTPVKKEEPKVEPEATEERKEEKKPGFTAWLKQKLGMGK